MSAPGITLRVTRRGLGIWRHLDVPLVLVTMAIAALGSLMVYSATRDLLEAQGLSPTEYLTKQAIFAAVGVLVMFVAASIDYHRWRLLAAPIYLFTVLLLLAVMKVGHQALGAQAWFSIGPLQLEPSELAKLGLIIGLGAYCARHKGELSARHLIVALVIAGIPFVLVYKQPDLGSALVLGAILVAILLIGGAKGRYLLALGVLAGLGIAAVVHYGILKQYQESRLTTFLHAPAVGTPNAKDAATYNLQESKLAVADGGLTGRGLFKGPQTNMSYVPEQQTDFIFTALAEQFGLAGSALLLVLFLIMVWRIWRIATHSADLLGTLFCVGVLAMIMFQVFENIGMTMGIMPVAGIPLPFMSYGGSALLVCFAAVGVTLSVRMRSR